MASKAERVSILDGLKAGAVIADDGDKGSEQSGVVAGNEPGSRSAPPGNGTGNASGNSAVAAGNDDTDGLEPAEAFGPEPEFADAGPAENNGNVDALGRDASKPRGKASPNYGKRTQAKTNLRFIEKALSGIHSILAVVSRDDLWELSDDETKMLAEALGNVQDQYDISLDPKTQAWLELAGVASAIYGPRVAAKVLMSARKAKEVEPEPSKETKAKTSGGVVVPTTPMNNTTNGKGPMGAFTPAMMYPPGMAGGGEE